MAAKRKNGKIERREFLKKVAAGGALAGGVGDVTAKEVRSPAQRIGSAGKAVRQPAVASQRIEFPRTFSGRNLKTIAFPLGGIGTGTISLGGRGQLRDWEIFNRPDKGNSPAYCFPSIWAKAEGRKPVAKVLEARIEPPFEGESGLGVRNVPGLPRLFSAKFTGAYPFARIEFQDKKLPLSVDLDAFNPLVPLDVEASGLPIAVLRYHLRNEGTAPVKVGVAFSLENPVGEQGRQAGYRRDEGVSGLFMDNPFLPSTDPLKGSMFLGVLGAPESSVSYLRGWMRTQWWDGPLTFWDDFTDDGALKTDSPAVSSVGSIAVTQSLPAGGEASVAFLLAWYFPNRTPGRCGWVPPVPEDKQALVGNYYCQRFRDAWDVALHVARELPAIEKRSRRFAKTLESSTLPPAALDAAASNLSTLRTNTAFQTADGEFFGFEGCNDHIGCCQGTCTHVWNYEQATAFVFPSLARSIRESEFMRNTRADGLMGFRSFLPDGKKIGEHAAADGQMGCLMKLYRDWQLSGDTEWLRRLWPNAKRALEFAWVKGGWDANKDGVAEGVQHNTYDVEFYGPNPLCGVWYLGALRAAEEMARALGSQDSAAEYRRLFESGSRWIDANLFNGEYYIQKIEGWKKEDIYKGLIDNEGFPDTEKPDYQVGEACLVDQLLGQYMAHVAGLGYLLDEQHVKQALKSIFRNNYLPDMSDHETVQRTYALNDEAAVVIATYPHGKRPEIPFPYFGEAAWTGEEYQFAAHLIYEGMLAEGVTVAESARLRFDGEKRNPWNEPECGHHYARAMSSWALIVALSGFHYSAVDRKLSLMPRVHVQTFRCFWSVPGGWGEFSQTVTPASQSVAVDAIEGSVAMATVALQGHGKPARKKISARLGNETLAATVREDGNLRVISLGREVRIAPGQTLTLSLSV